MVVMYNIAGRQVGSHIVSKNSLSTPISRSAQKLTLILSQLAMATLGTLFVGSWAAMRGGEKKKEQGPPINATSKDEENFIQYDPSSDSYYQSLTLLQGIHEERGSGREEDEALNMGFRSTK